MTAISHSLIGANHSVLAHLATPNDRRFTQHKEQTMLTPRVWVKNLCPVIWWWCCSGWQTLIETTVSHTWWTDFYWCLSYIYWRIIQKPRLGSRHVCSHWLSCDKNVQFHTSRYNVIFHYRVWLNKPSYCILPRTKDYSIQPVRCVNFGIVIFHMNVPIVMPLLLVLVTTIAAN